LIPEHFLFLPISVAQITHRDLSDRDSSD